MKHGDFTVKRNHRLGFSGNLIGTGGISDDFIYGKWIIRTNRIFYDF